MSEPSAVPFAELEWEEEAPGVKALVASAEGARWAVVEYAPGAGRPEWCTEGHRGYVISGRIGYEIDGRAPVEASAGEGFVLPAGAPHRGRNLDAGPTRLFVIDDPA